jgi:phosphoribosyl 1,2-cyclic phosphodiesterase
VRLLIDAGFSGKRIRERLATIGRTPETLNGILITHEHSDHTMGLKVIAAKLGIPLYANRLTLDAISSQTKAHSTVRFFTLDSPLILEMWRWKLSPSLMMRKIRWVS